VVEAEGQQFRFNIHGIDLDAFYNQVKGRLGPYLNERERARVSRMYDASGFRCNPDESGGYDRSDPKHPDWHSVHADIWDMREGK
jgi:hypothetical protein